MAAMGHPRRFNDVGDRSGLPRGPDVLWRRSEPTRWANIGLLFYDFQYQILGNHLAVAKCVEITTWDLFFTSLRRVVP